MEGTHARDGVASATETTGELALRSAGSFDHSPRNAWIAGAAGVGLFCIMLILLAGSAGCRDQVSLIPNSDPALRKTRAEFARDALARHPYKADADRGGKLNGAATANYDTNTLMIANFTPDDWENIEVWVNGRWVVLVPKVPGNAQTARTINFEMLYDQMGRAFPNDNMTRETMVQKVEIYRDGKMYELAGLSVD